MKTMILLTFILLALYFTGVRSLGKWLLSIMGNILLVSLKPSMETP